VNIPGDRYSKNPTPVATSSGQAINIQDQRVPTLMMLLLLFAGTMALSLWAMYRVKSVYNRFSEIPASSGATGAEVAAAILDRAGIRDVTIEAIDEMLGDHYDPSQKRLVLSSQNYYGRSLAALGVSAHECGHAIQHQIAYAPLHWRMAAVGITTFANQIVMWLPLIGMFTGLIKPYTGAWIMVFAWGVIMAFNLITLPVEFDASRRAKVILADMGFIGTPAEINGVRQTLDAAAWTYVAAFVTSLGYLLYHLLPLIMGGSRNRDE
jgi:Zn-dependent membrane protease YugP